MDFTVLLLCVGVFLLGVIIGCVVTLSLIYPAIGRAIGRVVGRIVAALALAIAAGLAVWPTVCMIRGDTMRPILLPLRLEISAPGDAYGFGAALLVLGGISLWLSFRGSAKKADAAPTESRSPAVHG